MSLGHLTADSKSVPIIYTALTVFHSPNHNRKPDAQCQSQPFASHPARATRLAFGTGTALYQSAAAKQVTQALNAGFRFVDGAEVYANEESLGEGVQEFLKSSGLKRDDLYVLTKVGKDGMADLQSAVKTELKKLQVEQLDSYLLHFPPRGKDGLPSNVDAWKELEKIKKAG